MSQTQDAFFAKLWAGLTDALYFPKTMVLGIPLFIFISLFFVPESFAGLTHSSQTMAGTHQNKWLFDVIYFSSILLFINLHLAAFFKSHTRAAAKSLNSIFKFNGKPAHIKLIFYLIFFIYCLSMNLESSHSTRFLMEYNRVSYINFFIYIVLFYYIVMISGAVVFSIKED